MARQPMWWSLRLAVRSLNHARGTTLIAMVTLGIGLAAAVALLGVIDSGARALPVPDGSRVVELEVRDERAARITPPAPVTAWANGAGIEDAGAVQSFAASLTHERAVAQRRYGAAMHASVLRLLRVQPALGRLPGDDVADTHTIVLGWDVWQDMGADRALLGTQLDVDGTPHTIIGVMPPGFGFPEKHTFWTVLSSDESGEIVARIASDASPDAAAQAVQARLAAVMHDTPTTPRVIVQGWTHSRDSGGEGVALAALGTLVVLLLLVCCANVATLLLVRGSERAGVLAVHAALGATRARVTSQLLLECTLIAVGGGLVGLAGGFAMLRWMQLNLSQHWGYYWMTMEVRTPVLLATFALVLMTALLAGTVPSLRAGRVNIAGILVGSGRARTGRTRGIGRWFVGAQVMLSTLGLIAALALAWQFDRIARVAERLPVDDVVIGAAVLPQGEYDEPARRAQLVMSLRNELARIERVTSVSITGAVPGGGAGAADMHIADAAPVAVTWVSADERMVDVYRMRLVAGRNFDERDTERASPVVMVTNGLARQLGDKAIGRNVRIAGVHGEDRWAEIVGVVEDWFPERANARTHRVFVPFAQATTASIYFSLDTNGAPADVLSAVRAAVARADNRLPVDELQTLHDRMSYFSRMYRVIAGFGMLGGFGSAVVAGIGLYGVMAFQVRARRREIGIRMAVGAARSTIMVDIMRDSVLRVAPGLALGAMFALASVPLLRAAGPRTEAPPLVLITAVVAITLVVIAIVAAAEPAWRAARVDPQEVLRAD